ncbi:hypothetical protein AAVH_14948 [Aphelenchoides avenae]|nr:hypothetical protein AAVH_14948 [Aphelenchus avenae]
MLLSTGQAEHEELNGLYNGTLYFAKLSKDEIATLQKELDNLGDKDPQVLFVEVVKLLKPKDAVIANKFDQAQQELFKGRDALPSEEAKKFINKYMGKEYLTIELKYPAQKAPDDVVKAVQARELKDFQALSDEAKKALKESPTFKKEIDALTHPHSP